MSTYPDRVFINRNEYRITAFGPIFQTDRGERHILSHHAVSVMKAGGAVFSGGNLYSLHSQPKE